MDDPGSSPPDGQADDEAALLAGLRAGDGAAFERLVRLHGPRLLHLTRGILRNEEDACEAVQDAFLSAFRGIGDFGGAARLSTWLHRIAVNAALMKLRNRRRHPSEQSIDALLPAFLEDGHQAAPAAPWRVGREDVLERKELRQLVRDAIDRLPDTYRTVLLLRDIEGRDTEETARLLDVNAGTVKVRLHRARQALRALLDPHFREAAP